MENWVLVQVKFTVHDRNTGDSTIFKLVNDSDSDQYEDVASDQITEMLNTYPPVSAVKNYLDPVEQQHQRGRRRTCCVVATQIAINKNK
jgi:hypothetical protein